LIVQITEEKYPPEEGNIKSLMYQRQKGRVIKESNYAEA
jgi:hypothetical protein